MAVGGYCPGTSTVALASGRLDGLLFMAGMVIGVGLFAQVFEPIKGFYLAAAGPRGQTLTQLFGLPAWAVIGVLIIIAAGGFALGNWCERRIRRPIDGRRRESRRQWGRGRDRRGDRDREPADQLASQPVSFERRRFPMQSRRIKTALLAGSLSTIAAAVAVSPPRRRRPLRRRRCRWRNAARARAAPVRRPAAVAATRRRHAARVRRPAPPAAMAARARRRAAPVRPRAAVAATRPRRAARARRPAVAAARPRPVAPARPPNSKAGLNR